MGEDFVGTEPLAAMGKQLQAGDSAPDFRLDYFDLMHLTVHAIYLADSAGVVRLLNMVNSLQRPVCRRVTRQWEALCAALSPEACISPVSRDSPQTQANLQGSAGLLHQVLSAQRSEQFGQD